MKTTTLIIGGGLSGLNLAAMLSEAGHDFHLVEARDRLGGRILTASQGGRQFDLGPAWFWPGQPRIDALIQKLDLARFEQYAHGALTFEDEHGTVERGRGFASMQGSYRLEDGLSALTDAIASHIPNDRISVNSVVTSLRKSPHGVTATTTGGVEINAKNVVFALPPRLVRQFNFAPALPLSTLNTMESIATWMAGQAKAVAVYDTPFWREAGLSGDAMSRRGPMVEIHDASPSSGGPYALFGFIGVPAQTRGDATGLRQAVVAQLTRLFGERASQPLDVFVKDWAFDRFTSAEMDMQPLYAHPTYGLPPELKDVWNGRLIFSGTETASHFGGYLEGALEASENALTLLEKEKV